jgi:hypothetical protein
LGTFLRRTRYVFMTEDFSVRPNKPLTPEQRKERDAVRRADAEQAMREHDAAQKAFYANKERLKAQRLARERAEQKAGEGKSAAGSR